MFAIHTLIKATTSLIPQQIYLSKCSKPLIRGLLCFQTRKHSAVTYLTRSYNAKRSFTGTIF